jgi:hypothetical protein
MSLDRQPLGEPNDDNRPGDSSLLNQTPQLTQATLANRRGQKRRRWWPIVAPVTLLAVGASLLSPAARHQWALSLIRQPSHYTSLSFDEASALPSRALKGKPIAVSFTVSNQEGHSVHYRYVLTQSDSAASKILQSSARTVSSGANWNVHTTIKPTCATSPCQIKIALPGHPETIDFLLTVKAKSKRHR